MLAVWGRSPFQGWAPGRAAQKQKYRTKIRQRIGPLLKKQPWHTNKPCQTVFGYPSRRQWPCLTRVEGRLQSASLRSKQQKWEKPGRFDRLVDLSWRGQKTKGRSRILYMKHAEAHLQMCYLNSIISHLQTSIQENITNNVMVSKYDNIHNSDFMMLDWKNKP